MIRGSRNKVCNNGGGDPTPDYPEWVVSDGVTLGSTTLLNLGFPSADLNGVDTSALDTTWGRTVFIGDSMYLIKSTSAGMVYIRIQYTANVATSITTGIGTELTTPLSWSGFNGVAVKNGVLYAGIGVGSTRSNFLMHRFDTATGVITNHYITLPYTFRHVRNVFTSPDVGNTNVYVLTYSGTGSTTFTSPRLVTLDSNLNFVESVVATFPSGIYSSVRPMPDGKHYARATDGIYEFSLDTATTELVAATPYTGSNMVYRNGVIYTNLIAPMNLSVPRVVMFDTATGVSQSSPNFVLSGDTGAYLGTVGLLPSGGAVLMVSGAGSGGVVRVFTPSLANSFGQATADLRYNGALPGCEAPDGYWYAASSNANGVSRVRQLSNRIDPTHAEASNYYKQQLG